MPDQLLINLCMLLSGHFERDAQDLGLIMKHYLDAGNQDRVYSELGDGFDLLTEDFDYEKASARMLGRDVGRLLTETSRPILERILLESDDNERVGALAMAMIRNNANYHGDLNIAMAMLGELRTGISQSQDL